MIHTLLKFRNHLIWSFHFHFCHPGHPKNRFLDVVVFLRRGAASGELLQSLVSRGGLLAELCHYRVQLLV